MKKMTRHRFDYTPLDELLKNGPFPEEVGNQLDETLNDLVHYSGVADGYSSELPLPPLLVLRARLVQVFHQQVLSTLRHATLFYQVK